MISSWSSELPWSVSATSSWLTCCVRQSRSWHRIQSDLARSRPSASSRDWTVTPHLCKPSSSQPSSSLVVLERYRHSIFSVVSPQSFDVSPHRHPPRSLSKTSTGVRRLSAKSKTSGVDRRGWLASRLKTENKCRGPPQTPREPPQDG